MPLLRAAACGVLVAIALADGRSRVIPNRLNLALALVGALYAALGGAPLGGALLGAACVAGPMLLLCLAMPGAFGGGDIKLAAAAGLLLGWRRMLLAFFLALLGGGAYAVWLLLTRRATAGDHFAFGPFLCAGIACALFWGEGLLAWYAGLAF